MASSSSVGQRPLILWQVLSALLLLGSGGIHLYLVLDEVGGVLGVLFVLNAIGGLVLAIAMIAVSQRLLPWASLLSLLFMAGSLLALILSLTPVTFFGIQETMDYQLVTTTLIEESIGMVVLLVTTILAFRKRT